MTTASTSNSTTTTSATGTGSENELVIVQLDPKVLAAHPANIRTDLGDLTELANSIRSVGILEPIVIVPILERDDEPQNVQPGDGDGEDSIKKDDNQKNGHKKRAEDAAEFRIVAGHRRVAAAIAAKQPTVPCVIRPDLAGDVEALTGMIAENVLRANLTPSEEAAAYAQLAAFDLTPAQIAKRTGRSSKTVKDALKMHALPEPVKERVATQTLTLDDAAAIAEFAGDEKAHARLLKAADTGYGLAYALAEERRRRDKKQRTETNRAALKKAGITLVPTPQGWPYNSEEARVTDLAPAGESAGDEQTVPFTAELHATCPGHAAFLDKDGQPSFICRNPDSHAHRRLRATQYVTPEEAARRQAEQDVRDQRAEAHEVASTVRREFLRALLNTAKPPTDLQRISLLILFGYTLDADRGHAQRVADLLGIVIPDAPDSGDSADGGDEDDAPTLGGAYRARVEASAENRLWQHPIAHAAALAEANLDRAASARPWGYRPALTVLWLNLLASHGHQISEIEQTLLDEANAPDPDDEIEDDDLDREDDVEDVDGVDAEGLDGSVNALDDESAEAPVGGGPADDD